MFGYEIKNRTTLVKDKELLIQNRTYSQQFSKTFFYLVKMCEHHLDE